MKIDCSRWIYWASSLLFLVVAATSERALWAQDTGISGTYLEFYRPSIDPFGYFGVNTPQLLEPGKPYFKISQSVSGDHVFQIAVNGVPVDLVNRVLTSNLIGAVGISHFLTVAIDVPFHPYAREANFDTLAPFTTSSVGDIRMALKFRLLEEKGKRPGLALLFSNTFPTGDERKFLGTSHMVPGVEFLVGKELKHFEIAGNFGARFPQQKAVQGVNFDDQITYGAGIKVPFGFWDPLLSVVGEIRGHVEPNRVRIITAPVEFTVGLQKEFRNGIILQGGGGGAWNNAIGNPRVRALFSLSYSPPAGRYDKPTELPPKELEQGELEQEEKDEFSLEQFEKRVKTTVYFRSGASQPTLESAHWAREVAELPKGHPEIEKILIEGYTDNVEGWVGNLRLSWRRAQTVKEILVQNGVDPTKIEVKGWGESGPVASNDTAQDRQLNRRVEISVIDSQLHEDKADAVEGGR